MHNNPMTHRILVADDERAVREFVSRALENDGYFVDSVHDGLAALGALAAHSYDLLLADIVMPGLDGVELALKVAKDYPDVTIVLMTGYAREKQRTYGLESLIDAVVSKPFSLRQICEVVRTSLVRADGRAPGQPA